MMHKNAEAVKRLAGDVARGVGARRRASVDAEPAGVFNRHSIHRE